MIDTTHAVTLRPTRDERLTLYVIIVVGFTSLAVFTGEPRFAIIGAAFTAPIALGLTRNESTPVRVRCEFDSVRCIEGDVVDGRIDLDGPAGFGVEIRLDGGDRSLTPPPDQRWAWHIPAGSARPIGIPFSVTTHRWGVQQPGSIIVRLIDNGSLLDRIGEVGNAPSLSVLPGARQLDRLLPPARIQTSAGAHLATRRLGDGYDFAELREHVPGDRIRDVNWRASLRRGDIQVNRRHPERAGEVVILLDPLPDGLNLQSEVGLNLAVRTGRAAWEVARAHLAANDRVGIAAEGFRTTYLAPTTGRRARYAVLDAVMGALTPTTALRLGSASQPFDIPPAALVVAISPLERPRSIERLVSLRQRGRSVAVVALDISDLTADVDPDLPDTVRRLSSLLFEGQVAGLRRRGVQAVEWRSGQDISRLIMSLDQLRETRRRPA